MATDESGDPLVGEEVVDVDEGDRQARPVGVLLPTYDLASHRLAPQEEDCSNNRAFHGGQRCDIPYYAEATNSGDPTSRSNLERSKYSAYNGFDAKYFKKGTDSDIWLRFT